MRSIFIVGFVLMIAAQWYAPLSMIVESNKTIDDGTEYKFKTRPVDPSDPFRGKYITLTFDEETCQLADSTGEAFADNSIVYAIVTADHAGFAKIADLRAEPPSENVDYMAVTNLYAHADIEATTYLRFPFSRFYLEESKASEAERVYWEGRTDSTMVCYAKVKVLNGDAKLVDVMVNDSSIVDVVRRINADKDEN